MMNRDAFAALVKDALSNLYDPVHLQVHPLVELLGVATVSGEATGEALRRTLREAIDALKRELAKVRTGRANLAILDGVRRGRYAIVPGLENSIAYRLSGLLGNAVYPIMDMMVADARKKKAKNAH